MGAGNVSVVEFILRNCDGIDINTENFLGETPLILASFNGYKEIVKLLLEVEGIDINKGDRDTALIKASSHGHSDVVKLLLARENIDINKRGMLGWTALIIASFYGESEVVKLLLEKKGIDINKDDDAWLTALYYALNEGHLEIVKLLLRSPDIDMNKLYNGVAVLWMGYVRGHKEIVQLLLENPKTNITKGLVSDGEVREQIRNLIYHKDRGNMEPAEELIVASLLGNNTSVAAILKNHEGIENTQDSLHRTPLFWASTRGHIKVLEELLTHTQIQVNTRSTDGATALYQASRYGLLDILTLLLEQPSIDVNTGPLNRKTPLVAATIHGHSEVVEKLLSVVKTNVNNATFDGKTALIYAVSTRHVDIIELLLRCPQTDTSLMNEEYKTAFDIAKEKNQTESIKLFTSRGSLQINEGHTCCSKSINRGLHKAVKNNNLAWIKSFLVCPGIDLNIHNKDGYTPLNLATERGQKEMVKILLADQRIDVNRLNTGQKQNVVLIASEKGNIDILKLLLLHPQTFVNQRNANGDSALSWALKKYRIPPNIRIAKLLIKCPKTQASNASIDKMQEEPELRKLYEVSKETKQTTCCHDVKQSLLHKAWVGDFRAIRGLLQCPGSELNVNFFDVKGRTPLYIAAMLGHLLAVDVLLDHDDVNVNISARLNRGPDRGTAFSIASQNFHFEVMKTLIQYQYTDECKGWCSDSWVENHLKLCEESNATPEFKDLPPINSGTG